MFGARVLRSGRRVMTSSPSEAKYVKASAGVGPTDKEEWIEILEGSRDGKGGIKCNGDDAKVVKKILKQDVKLVSENKWGIVYSRKRKRVDCVNDDRKFGKYYVRKGYGDRRFLGILVGSLSCCGNGVLGRFLESVLRYMTRAELSVPQLLGFTCSEGFACAYSSCGIQFLWGSLLNKSSGICKIFGARCFVPFFMVDFSALPSCFMYLHASLFLRSTCLPHFLLSYPTNLADDGIVGDDKMVADEERVEAMQQPGTSALSEADSLGIQIVSSVNVNLGKKSSLRSSLGAPRVTGRSVQFKTGIITRSRSIQKRRSSLRSRRVKSSSGLRGRVANGSLLSSLLSFRHDSIPLEPLAKSNSQLSSMRSTSSSKSSSVELTKDISSASCSANILVVESAKCYRIVGAIIELERTVSRRWSLVVKKDGNKLYYLNARKIMRPCSSNRVTHDIIWREENNDWKLEFPYRGDWMIFKELYKECSERNMQALPANIIPVPGVQEVSDYAESNHATFSRPDVYITVRDGELLRAFANKTPNYDMDSEDEEWVKKFNEESSLINEHWDHASEDTFEMIIDALEKASFRNPNHFSDEREAMDSCLHLERKEVVEAVYSYWTRKRKHKRSALVRVFQCYQPRKTQLLSKPFIRKKRSFKRQPSRPERAKQRTFLPIAPELDPVEEQKALLKVEEAKAATARSVDAAIEKRNKAQLLMEKADVATYKAAMALRITEAAQIAESLDVSDYFLLE